MTKKSHDDIAIRREPAMQAAPGDMFSRLRGEIDRLFDDMTFPGFGPLMHRQQWGRAAMPSWMPAWSGFPVADLVEHNGSYELTLELPGMDASDIDLRMSDGTLSVHGEKTAEKTEDKGDYHMSERRYGKVQRTISLPDGIDSGKVEARFDKVVLTVSLPKSEAAKTAERRIEIKAA